MNGLQQHAGLNQPSLLVLVIEIDSFINYLLSKTSSQISSNGGNYNYINGSISSRNNYDDENRVFSMQDLMNTISIYCNSYALMHRLNQLCVIASLSNTIEIIYPNSGNSSHAVGAEEEEDYKNANIFVPFSHTLTSIINKYLKIALAKQIDEYKNADVTATTAVTTAVTTTSLDNNNSTSESQLSKLGSLSMAFSTALTIINKQKMKQSRVLVLQFDKDTNQNYNSIMNSIFSAQKLNVLFDALVMSAFDSHIMQQACFLTGGIYLKHSDIHDLLQMMHTYFLSDQANRVHLNIPTQKSVDFKASCHCHKRPVEFAYMCSVCLTLTCSISSKCEVCLTEVRPKSNIRT